MSLRSIGLILVVNLFAAPAALATVTVYQDEAVYRTALLQVTGETVEESFESSMWAPTQPVPGIPGPLTSQGLIWQSSEHLRTHLNWAYRGNRGLCDNIGNPDMISITAPRMYGVGGWFIQSTPSNIAVFLDDVRQTQFMPPYVSTDHAFFGIIDTDGFATIRFDAETAGHWGTDAYTIGVPEPGALLLLGAVLLFVRRR
jgi:hypothetical protein